MRAKKLGRQIWLRNAIRMALETTHGTAIHGKKYLLILNVVEGKTIFCRDQATVNAFEVAT